MATERATPEAFEVEQVDGVSVVRFLRRTILDPETIAAIGDRLQALAHAPAAMRLVLEFSRVESLTSAMLGRLVTLHQAVAAHGGQMAFCCVDPFLMQIFTVCQIPQTIPIVADVPAAVRHLSGQDTPP